MVGAGVAVAGAVAATAYANAKYHLGSDLSAIGMGVSIFRSIRKRVREDKKSIWYDFENQVSQRPNGVGIWYRANPEDQAIEYTWSQFYNQSCRYAHFLLDHGVKPGQLVATYLINSPEFMLTLVGTWAIGCAPAQINYNLNGDGLVHCLKVSGSTVLLVDEDDECRERIEAVRHRIENELGMRIIILDAPTRAAIDGYSPDRPADDYRRTVTETSPIFLFYTSGTTGFPKACPFQTQRAYILGVPRVSASAVQPGERWYDCMPLYHGTGASIAVGCMMTGMTLCIGRKFSTRHFWQDIHDSKANGFVYVGETARYLLAAPPSPLDKDHSLKCMFGNGLRPDVWAKFQDRFNVPVVNEFFNSTEGVFGLINICKGPFRQGAVGHHGAIFRFLFRNAQIPVRVDHENGDAILRDPTTGFARRNSYDEGGEILVAVPNQEAFVGYYNNKDATDKRFERDVFRKGDLFYRTGDALRRDPDGRWFFLDRLGDTFRWKAQNVSTAEVAEALGRFPNLLEANVYGVEVPHHEGRAGCAAVFLRPDDRAAFDWRALLAHNKKALPRYAVPVFIRVLESHSTMHNNKQNKVPLRKEGVDPAKIAAGDAGTTDKLLWMRPGGHTYEPFGQREFDQLAAGKARL